MHPEVLKKASVYNTLQHLTGMTLVLTRWLRTEMVWDSKPGHSVSTSSSRDAVRFFMNKLQVANNHCFKGGRGQYLFLENKYTCFTSENKIKIKTLLFLHNYSQKKQERAQESWRGGRGRQTRLTVSCHHQVLSHWLFNATRILLGGGRTHSNSPLQTATQLLRAQGG